MGVDDARMDILRYLDGFESHMIYVIHKLHSVNHRVWKSRDKDRSEEIDAFYSALKEYRKYRPDPPHMINGEGVTLDCSAPNKRVFDAYIQFRNDITRTVVEYRDANDASDQRQLS